MICKKIFDMEQLPASCSGCPFFDESIFRHGGIETGHYFNCSQLSGESLGCAASDMPLLTAHRSEKCPLLDAAG